MSFSRTKKRMRFFLTVLLIMSFANCIIPGTLLAEESNGYTVTASQENPDSDQTAEASNEEVDESVTTSVYNDNEDNEPVETGEEDPSSDINNPVILFDTGSGDTVGSSVYEDDKDSVTSVYEEKESVVSVYEDPYIDELSYGDQGFFMDYVIHEEEKPSDYKPSKAAEEPAETEEEETEPAVTDENNEDISDNIVIVDEDIPLNFDYLGQIKPTTEEIEGSGTIPTVEETVYEINTEDLTNKSYLIIPSPKAGEDSGMSPIMNEAAHFDVDFSPKANNAIFKLTRGSASVSVSAINPVKVKGKVNNNESNFEGIFPDTDIKYKADKHCLKEDIVIHKHNGKSEFYFQMDVENANYRMMTDGTILFSDPDSKRPLFYMAKPFAVDSKGERCDAVNLELAKDGSLKLSVDPEWLKNAAYPVTIDPTIWLCDAAFSRNSAAYKQDGSSVSSNNPRYETGRFNSAIMMEEGTTNTLTANQSSIESSLPAGYVGNGGTVAQSTAVYRDGAACMRIDASAGGQWNGADLWNNASGTAFAVTPGATYTFSFYAKGVAGGENIVIRPYKTDWTPAANGIGATLNSTSWTRLTNTFTVPAGCNSIFFILRKNNVSSAISWYVDCLQFEQKPYGTSWMSGGSTRAAETLTVNTNGIFNKHNWAVDMWYIPKLVQNTTQQILWYTNIDGNNRYRIWVDSAGRINGGVGSGGTYYDIASSTSIAPESQNFITLTGDGATLHLMVNGAEVSSRSYSEPVGILPAKMYFGSDQNSVRQANGLLDTVRISNRARTLAEHQAAYNNGLEVDEFTTCSMSFDGDIKAYANIAEDSFGIEPYFNYTTAALGDGWSASINTYNLNLVLKSPLFNIPGRGLSIGESITYNSLDKRGGPLGMGWRLGSDINVVERPDANVALTEGDGSTHVFTKYGSIYRAPKGVYHTLTKDAEGKFQITDKYKNVYSFDAGGKVSTVVDYLEANTTTYNYQNGRLSSLTDPSGRSISFEYNTEGLIDTVSDPENRSYDFDYENGLLTSVTNPENNTYAFTYDTSPGTNGYLETFTDPLDRVTTFTCNSKGQLQTLWDARTSGQDIYETQFTQSTQGDSLVTDVTDPGGHTSHYHHNQTGNMTSFVDPQGHAWGYTWENNKLTYKSNARGRTSHLYYDSKGNVTETITYVDNDSENDITNNMQYTTYSKLKSFEDGCDRKTSYNYSEKDELLSVDTSCKESMGAKYDQYGNIIEMSSGVSSNYNLLYNGSMEVPGSGGNLLDGWTRSGGAAEATLDDEFIPHGNSALKLSSSSFATTMFYQHIVILEADDCVTLRADIKLSGVERSGSTGGVVIKIHYGSNNWESLYCWGDGERTLVLTNHFFYQEDIDVYIGLENARGTVWFDGVQLERLAGPREDYSLSSFNSVENCGFQDNLDHWVHTGVTPVVYYGTYHSYDDSKKSAKLTHSTTMTSTIYQDVPVHGGELLTFSGMAETSGVNGTGAHYTIAFYDASNNQVGDTINTGYLTGTKDFTRLSSLADAPSQASYARVTGVLEGTGTVYFDTVKLVPRNSNKYEYDSGENYVTLSEDPLGYQSSSTYNEDIGTKESFTDAEGNTTFYHYDDLNRLDEVEDPSGSSAYYDYDDVSNLNATRDPRSASRADNNYLTLYGYTEIDQLDTLTDPLDRSTSSTYDRCGNLTSVTLPNGMQTSYTYDAAHRLTRKTLDDGKYFDYTYDDANYLISVTDQDSNSCTYNYDRAGRVLYSIDSFGRRLDYEWDKSHNLIEEKSSIHDYVNYYYRGDNKLSCVKFPDYQANRYYRYDDSGRVFQIRHPYKYDDEPAFTNISYYDNGWMKRITRPNGGSFYYEYYDNGNIKKIISGADTETFTYDDNGRLDTWTLNGVTKSYYYDEAGNLSDEENRDFTYNSANQITNQGFIYDENGNLTSDGTYIYAYNSENQLVEVRRVSDESLVATYSYNYDGLRKSKTVYSGQNSGTAEYHWDALGRLESESGSASFNKRYLYDNNGNMVAMEGGDTYEVHTNLRGDVVSITDEEDGNTVASYKYDPWGNVRYEYSNLYFEDQPFRYAGYYYDFETGLYYCQSRYYSPTLGRFLTKDSIDYIKYENPQTLNLYTYCGNNPVNCTDPTGQDSRDDYWDFVDECFPYIDNVGDGTNDSGYISVADPVSLFIVTDGVIYEIDHKDLKFYSGYGADFGMGSITWSPGEAVPGEYYYAESFDGIGGQVAYGPLGTDSENFTGSAGFGYNGGLGKYKISEFELNLSDAKNSFMKAVLTQPCP